MQLTGDYIGKVIYNQDPTFSGRCKIRVFGKFDELSDEMLPWFVPMMSSMFSGSGAGSISVPKLGAIVRVRFAGGDILSGEYTCIQSVDPELIEQIKDDYDGTQVLLYDSTKELAVMYQPLSGLKLYLAGSFIQITPDGRITLSHENGTNLVEINEGDINITTSGGDKGGAAGVINISAGNTVNINGGSVNITSNDVKIGANASSPAVIGTELIKVLKSFAAAIDMKMPTGNPMAGRTFAEILSNSVKVAR